MRNGFVKIKYLLGAIAIMTANIAWAKCFDYELKKSLKTDDKYVCGQEGTDYKLLSPPANFDQLIEKNKNIDYYSELKDENNKSIMWFKNINKDMENPWEELAAPACQDREVFVIEELKDGEPTGRKSFAIMRNNTMYGRWRHCDWPSNIPDKADDVTEENCPTVIDNSMPADKVVEDIEPIVEVLETETEPETETDTATVTENEPETKPDTATVTDSKDENGEKCHWTKEGKAAGEWDGEKCICVEGYENSDKDDPSSFCDIAKKKTEDDELTAEEALNLLGLPEIRSNSARPNAPQMLQPTQLPQKQKRGITRGYR